MNGYGLAKLDDNRDWLCYVSGNRLQWRYQWATRLRGQDRHGKLLEQGTPTINVVYTINEPAAAGAYTALKAAGKEKDVLIVSIDGGLHGCWERSCWQDCCYRHSSTPLVMASMGGGCGRIEYATSGKKASGYTDTGVTLISDKPMTGVDTKG